MYETTIYLNKKYAAKNLIIWVGNEYEIQVFKILVFIPITTTSKNSDFQNPVYQNPLFIWFIPASGIFFCIKLCFMAQTPPISIEIHSRVRICTKFLPAW